MRQVGTFLALLLCTVFGTTTTLAAPFHFASLGDWGCVPIGGWHKRDELTVARQFSNATAEIRARFILNTGDNFYRCGVHSKTDDVWNTTFEHVFTHESTKVPWWGCLGNHDYGFPGSAEAELAYRSPNKDRWNLPGRYYYRRLSFPGEVNISLVVLDSPPCQKEYRSSDPKHWDPCGSGKKPCPGCAFHQNVIEQNCTKQYEWLKSVMPTIPRDDWKIMMTHAPATSLNVEDLVSEFQKHDFDLYMNGHIHLLGHYKLDGKGTYITTGAACMVKIREGDRDHEEDDDEKKDKASRSACSGKSPWHKCESVFEQTVAGYSTHSFNADFTELSTHLFDYTGKLLHTAVSKKSKSKAELPEDRE